MNKKCPHCGGETVSSTVENENEDGSKSEMTIKSCSVNQCFSVTINLMVYAHARNL